MKKRLIALMIFMILVSIPGLLYWKSLVTSVVLSTLDMQFGIMLNYDKFDLNLFPGRVTLFHPRLMDTRNQTSNLLAFADGLKLSINPRKAVYGQLDMNRIQAQRMFFEITQLSDGELNWSRIIQRIRSHSQPKSVMVVQTPTSKVESLPGTVGSVTESIESDAISLASHALDIKTESKKDPTKINNVTRVIVQNKKDAQNSNTPSAKKNSGASAKSSKSSESSKSNATPELETSPNQSSENPPIKATPHPPLKLPVIDIEDLLLHYYAKDSDLTYAIQTDHFTFDPKTYFMTLQNSRASYVGRGDVNLTVKELSFKNILAPPGEKLDIVADSVHLNGLQIGEDRYDFNDITKIWVGVYREISSTVAPRKATPPIDRGFPIQSLKATNVSALIVPKDGKKDTPGTLSIKVNELDYRLDKDELVLSGVMLLEADKTVMQLDRLVLDGITNREVTVRNLVIHGGRLDIFEDPQGSMNVTRALESIRNIVESMIAKPVKTARSLPFLETIRNLSVRDSLISWNRNMLPDQQIAFGQLQYSMDTSILGATDFLLTRHDKDKKMAVVVPAITALLPGNLNTKTWDRLVVDRATFDFNWRDDQYELINAASDWVSLPKAIRTGMGIASATSPKIPFRIQELKINDADVQVMDYKIDPPIKHHLSALNLQWNQVLFGSRDVPMTPLILECALAEPSPGSLSFQGKVSSSGIPINVTGIASIAISDLTVFNPYLQASENALPVRIVKGGVRMSAEASITNDKVDGIIDIYLFDPVFEPNKSRWPLQLNQKTVIATLNNLKDKNGVVAFPDNKWVGDIRDTKFKRGLGINDLFWSNILGTLTTVLKIPFDIVDGVGSFVKKILGFEENNP